MKNKCMKTLGKALLMCASTFCNSVFLYPEKINGSRGLTTISIKVPAGN